MVLASSEFIYITGGGKKTAEIKDTGRPLGGLKMSLPTIYSTSVKDF